MKNLKKLLFSLVLFVLVLSGCTEGQPQNDVLGQSKHGNQVVTKTDQNGGDVKKGDPKEAPVKVDDELEDEGSVETDQIDDVTKDWQVYENKEYGIQFKYQPYWVPAATDIGINDENRHYLLDIFVLNNLDKINNQAYRLLMFHIVDTNKHEKYQSGEFYKEIVIDEKSLKIHKQESYFGYDFSVVFYKDDIEFMIKVGRIKDENEAIKILNEILDTLIIE